ncbi:MAG: DUF2892 domain-containing protein [Alphaproteobacteria bacterium]|nr:DUF2892 domain-containing protein [Alphaproteobacteria bacterium]
MTIDSAVMAFAGIMILAGIVLACFTSLLWLILPGFVGLNLVQAAFTGFCPAAIAFKKLGLKPGPAFNP